MYTCGETPRAGVDICMLISTLIASLVVRYGSGSGKSTMRPPPQINGFFPATSFGRDMRFSLLVAMLTQILQSTKHLIDHS